MPSKPRRQSIPAPSLREAKSDAMRRRLCEAAARRIALSGYHKTSIAQIVQDAGVSQGALLHHFPAKEDLIAATTGHLLNRSVVWFARAKADLRSREGFAAVIRRSWKEQFQTDEYAAMLEILVAARTESSLAACVAPLLDDWRMRVEAELASLLPAATDKTTLEAVLTISRCLMTGLVVQDSLAGSRARMERVIDAWLDLLDQIMRRR